MPPQRALEVPGTPPALRPDSSYPIQSVEVRGKQSMNHLVFLAK
jgi:hypothetical protein